MEAFLDKTRDLVRRLWRQARGITLLELVVVLSILAIVSSLITPAVSGQTTRARSATKASDTSTAQSAVDLYSGEAPTNSGGSPRYPVNQGTLPTSSDYHATITGFTLPDGSTTTLYVKPLIFSASYALPDSDASKTFAPDYLKWAPRHKAGTVDADGKDPTGIKMFSGGTVSFTGGNTRRRGPAPRRPRRRPSACGSLTRTAWCGCSSTTGTISQLPIRTDRCRRPDSRRRTPGPR